MKIKKNIYYIICGIFLIIGADLYFFEHYQQFSDFNKIKETEKFETYVKVDEKIERRESSEDEVTTLVQRHDRKMANTKVKEFMRGNRRIIGDKKSYFEDSNKPMQYLNQYNKNWKSLLSEHLLEFFPDGTKAIIKRKEGFVKVTNDRARLLEKTLVSINLPNGNRSSYHALVDSSNGRIIHTWDQTRHENSPYPIKISPSGIISTQFSQ